MSDLIRAHSEQMQSAAITATFYLDEIPAFVERELLRLYGHIYSSLAHIQTSKRHVNQVITYVAWHGATPIAVLLFHLRKRIAEVLNADMRIDEGELRRFAACTFRRFPSVGAISFAALRTNLRDFPFPVQQESGGGRFIITLPATPQDYNACLGKATRRNIRRYMRGLRKDYASISFQTYENKSVDEQMIRKLIQFSEARIAAKKLNFGIDENNAKCIIDRVKVCGVVNVIRINGQLCAGSISYRIGSTQLAEVIAHDPKYNAYSLGTLCYYLTICESIDKGVKNFDMGGTGYEYKFRLGAVQQDMNRLVIYRSLGQAIRNCDWAVKTWMSARLIRMKLWFLQRPTSLSTQFLIKAQRVVRGLKDDG